MLQQKDIRITMLDHLQLAVLLIVRISWLRQEPLTEPILMGLEILLLRVGELQEMLLWVVQLNL